MSGSWVTRMVVIPLLTIEALENRHNFDAGAGVERAGRFIGENDLRIVHQGAGDGDTLLLASRKLIGVMIGAFGKANRSQRLKRAGAGIA